MSACIASHTHLLSAAVGLSSKWAATLFPSQKFLHAASLSKGLRAFGDAVGSSALTLPPTSKIIKKTSCKVAHILEHTPHVDYIHIHRCIAIIHLQRSLLMHSIIISCFHACIHTLLKESFEPQHLPTLHTTDNRWTYYGVSRWVDSEVGKRLSPGYPQAVVAHRPH